MLEGVVQISAESVECNQNRFWNPFAKSTQGIAQCGRIAFFDFGLAEFGSGGRSCRSHIHKIKLEHPYAVVVPVLQGAHEIREESTLKKRHRRSVFVERIFQGGWGLNLYHGVGVEASPRF